MGIEEILENPEEYRIADNFRATNIVYPILYNGSLLVVKKARPGSFLINSYYFLQDKLFYGTRRLATARQRFRREIETLQQLQGEHAPRIIASNVQQKMLVREYISGKRLNELTSSSEIISFLDAVIESLEGIHDKSIVIGDSHIKNAIFRNGKTFWLDFDSVYDQSNLLLAKALDLVKFVYSTYTLTRNENITLYAAEIASHYGNPIVKSVVRDLVTPGLSAPRLWFPTRIPINGLLNDEIKERLRK